MRCSPIAILLIISCCGYVQGEEERWLKTSGYGLMFHYECFKDHDSARYNEIVDSLRRLEILSSCIPRTL